MATNRRVVLANDHIYHAYNRGVERRKIFLNTREYQRFVDTMEYYRYEGQGIRYSKYLQQPRDMRDDLKKSLIKTSPTVDLLAYCLMPNHFHLLLRQNTDRGISQYLATISNSYSKYFNTKRARVGPLLQGTFKAVHIESNEQLLHVSRYIHLNPVVSMMISMEQLPLYPWSSYPYYLGNPSIPVTASDILSQFSAKYTYASFVENHADYAITLEQCKHLYFEE